MRQTYLSRFAQRLAWIAGSMGIVVVDTYWQRWTKRSVSSSHRLIWSSFFTHSPRPERGLQAAPPRERNSSLQMLLNRSWPQHEDNIIFIILDPWMEVNEYAGNWQNHVKIILFGRLWISRVSRCPFPIWFVLQLLLKHIKMVFNLCAKG